MNTVLIGSQWGDEGKGKIIDVLTDKADLVVRYQGGSNAGHTVINERGKFILNLLLNRSSERACTVNGVKTCFADCFNRFIGKFKPDFKL